MEYGHWIDKNIERHYLFIDFNARFIFQIMFCFHDFCWSHCTVFVLHN